MKKFISLFLSTLIICSTCAISPVLATSSEPTDTIETTPTESEPVTTEPTVTVPTEAPATSIVLSKTSESVYIQNSIDIPVVVSNGNGATSYTSSNTAVAKVSSTGRVKALKKGTAIITITNNGVSSKFTVNVKNPKLNKTKLTLKTSKTYSAPKSFTIKITGKIGKATFKSSNKKIATVSKKGKITAKKKGKADITVKTNGIKLKCKVTVKEPTLLEKHIKKGNVKIILKQKVKSVTYNVGEKTRSVWKTFDHGADIYARYSEKELANFTEKDLDKIENKLYGGFENTWKILNQARNSVKFKTDNQEVLKVSKSGKLTIVGAGDATITVTVPTKSIQIKYHITKDKEKTLNGKRALCCYSPKELYNALKDTFYNYTIKGEKGYYKYYICLFEDKSEDFGLRKSAKNDFKNTGCIFGAYLDTNKEVHLDLDYKLFKEINTTVVCVLEEDYPEYLAAFKKLYDGLQKIIKEKNINECDTDYEKIIKFNEWTAENTTYDVDYAGAPLTASLIILKKTGACGCYAAALEYFALVEKIPCLEVDNDKKCHAWNIVRIDNKWYNCDLLSGNLFEGSNNYWINQFECLNGYLSIDNSQIEKEDSEHFFDVFPNKNY